MTFSRFALAALSLAGTAAHAATVPGVITYAVIGAADPNKKVPTIDAVQGAGISNVSMAFPVYILQPGVTYEVVVGAQNYGFSGNCVASYTLATGATGTGFVSSYSTESYDCPASSIATLPFPVAAIPNVPGAALLTATVTFGSTKVVTKIPLVIK